MRSTQYHLPLMQSTGQVQHSSLSDGFRVVKTFSSREGVVELSKSKRSGKLRIIKSVWHSDSRSPPDEAKALSRLPDIHENIVRLYAAELVHDLRPRALMCFEYCSGGDLMQACIQFKRSGLFPPALFCLHAFCSIADALSFIHHSLIIQPNGTYRRSSRATSEALVHQDIKADNIFLQWPGTIDGLPTIKLADFGLSAPASQTIPGNGCVAFMSPECKYYRDWRIRHLTSAHDVYSFGATCYDVLNHGRDYGYWRTGNTLRDIEVPQMYQGLGFTRFLKACLAYNPKDRCNFGSFEDQGLLSTIKGFRDRRDRLIREGYTIDPNHWVRHD